MRTCKECGISKPESEFAFKKDRKSLLGGYLKKSCKSCEKIKRNVWLSNNIDRVKTKSSQWYRRNRQKVSDNHKVWRGKNRDRRLIQYKEWRKNKVNEQPKYDRSKYEKSRVKTLPSLKVKRESCDPAYIKRMLKQIGYSKSVIEDTGFIELYSLIIKNKRLVKNL